MTDASERRGAAVRLDGRHFPLCRDGDAVRCRHSSRRRSPRSWGRAAPANRRCSIWSPASRRREAGRVLIADDDVTALPPAARPVSMIFQENNLFAHLDVAANVGLGHLAGAAAVAGRPRADRRQRWSAPGSPARSSACRANFPAASASASRWPACWCATGRCCCSTNRSPRSGRRCARKCSTCSLSVQAERRHDRRCWSRISRKMRAASPTTSFFSRTGRVAAAGRPQSFLRQRTARRRSGATSDRQPDAAIT